MDVSIIHLEVNSIWHKTGIDGLSPGIYRVLALYPNEDKVVLFSLEGEKNALNGQNQVFYLNFLSPNKEWNQHQHLLTYLFIK